MEWNEGSNLTRYGQIGFANAQFREAVTNGTVPMARLDNMVTRMVEPMLALGLKAHPPLPAAQNTEAAVQSPAHFALAASIAGQSICLLKNKGGILPLKPRACSNGFLIGLGLIDFDRFPLCFSCRSTRGVDHTLLFKIPMCITC